MDHWVELEGGQEVRQEIYVPLRIIANGDEAEVQLTLFRLPAMDEATFQRDADWVRRDLAALKALAETSTLLTWPTITQSSFGGPRLEHRSFRNPDVD
jgi:hypothetical protein